jgi:type I restriction enzyme S subunit
MKIKLSEITGGSRGSVIKFITKGMIENYKFTLPDDEALVETSDVFNQLTINIEENVRQIQTLVALRDTLLPRLINGKVEV